MRKLKELFTQKHISWYNYNTMAMRMIMRLIRVELIKVYIDNGYLGINIHFGDLEMTWY